MRGLLKRRVQLGLWAVTVVSAPLPAYVNALDPVMSRGLEHTDFDLEKVTAAVARANMILVGSGVQLGGIPLNGAQAQADRQRVPVFLIKSKPNSSSTPAFVPRGCRCVFVDPIYVSDWIVHNSEGTGRLALDRGYFLTFVLLHEAGHIVTGTPGAAVENGTITQLNTDPSKDKAAEEDADDFAIAFLRDKSRQRPANAASIDANWVVTELSKLSWNMQAYRSLDQFGAFAIGKREVFFDNGYSHPNLAWRILRANYLIQQSNETRQLLEAFEDARRRGANPEPLFRRDKP